MVKNDLYSPQLGIEGDKWVIWNAEIRKLVNYLILTLYTFLIISLLTVAHKLHMSELYSQNLKLILKCKMGFMTNSEVKFGIRQLTSCWVLIIVGFLCRYRNAKMQTILMNLGYPQGRVFRDLGRFAKLQIFLSFWVTFLNLMLIVITLPAIKNPGPDRFQNLSCLYQNVRGFVPFSGLSKKIPPLDRNKLNDFQTYVYESKPGLILLTETWLTKEHLDNEIFPNDSYHCFRLDRSTKTHPPDPINKKKFREKGGGVLIAVRSDLNVESKQVAINSKAEILSLELKFSNKEIVCVTLCYRVGTLGMPNFNEIEKHLRTIAQKKKFSKHIILGDFNFSKTSWPETQSSDNIENQFLDLFGDLGLEQMICQPTHQAGRILDLLFTTSESLISDVSVAGQHDVCHSDHFAITFKVNSKVERVIRKRKTLNFKKANWEGLNKALNSVKWDNLLGHDESETAWRKFKLVLSSLIDKFIPSVVVKENHHPPWFDDETFKMHQKKTRLRLKYKESGLLNDYDRYSECRKQFKVLLNEKMQSYVEDEYDPSLISKKFWKYLKSTSGGSRVPETVNYGSRFRNNPGGQSELFNEFFCDQFSEASNYDIDIDFSHDMEFDIDFDFRRVRKLLKNVKPNKAAGPDNIHGKILKNCAVSLAYPLSLIFKTSYNSGMIPNDWKAANVVPVHKKGSKMSVENYRPISLTSLVMKLFERIISEELMIKCESQLRNNQHGFLPKKSCTTQLINFAESVAFGLNLSIRTDVVYFDFAKAFDSVNHDIILRKLKNNFKIDGTMLKFMVNYLQDRKQCVVIAGEKSNMANVRSGVPQGSILGPLLFVLFIDDMSEVVSEDTQIALYADDTKIWRRINSWEDHIALQRDIDALHKWSIDNKMKFHPQKCKVVPVSPPGKGLKDLFNKIFPLRKTFFYKLDGTELEFVKEEKDLGVLVSSNFSWNQQLDALFSKASSRLGLLKRTMHFMKCQKQRRAFYLAVVRSQFEHCSQVWRPSSETSYNKLERIQRRAVKWILSEEDHSYNEFEYLMRLRDLDLIPLDRKFQLSDLLLFFDIYQGDSCLKLPEYIKHASEEHRSRLRSKIVPPKDLDNNKAGLLSQMRNSRVDSYSLRCEVDPRNASYKGSFFFRCVQEWNCLPSEIKEIISKPMFKEKLTEHIKNETFRDLEVANNSTLE